MSYRRRSLLTNRREQNKAGRKPTISKAAKDLIESYGLHFPEDIIGTGKNGNIIKADALAWLDQYHINLEEE